MKISYCLFSCNDNPKYYSFFPYIKKIWEKKLGVKCILIYIGDILPDLLKKYQNDIIIFEPIENMNTAYIAQNIRLLYPALIKCDDGVIIADIDIIPLSNKYFIQQISSYTNDLFINYTYETKCDDIKEYYICYNVALPATWSKIFNINSIEDIKKTLILWYRDLNYHYDDKYRSKCIGFHNDQLMLYKYINDYPNNFIILIPRKISRLEINLKNKINVKKILEEINNDIWYDFHIPKNINKNILEMFI